MENEEKKHGKHIYEIRLSLTCHFFSFLFTPKPKKRTNLELDDLDELESGWSALVGSNGKPKISQFSMSKTQRRGSSEI